MEQKPIQKVVGYLYVIHATTAPMAISCHARCCYSSEHWQQVRLLITSPSAISTAPLRLWNLAIREAYSWSIIAYYRVSHLSSSWVSFYKYSLLSLSIGASHYCWVPLLLFKFLLFLFSGYLPYPTFWLSLSFSQIFSTYSRVII